jgi:hypothetical protein
LAFWFAMLFLLLGAAALVSAALLTGGAPARAECLPDPFVVPALRWSPATGASGYGLWCRRPGEPWGLGEDLPCSADEDGIVTCPGVDRDIAAARCGAPISGEWWEYAVDAYNAAGRSPALSNTILICWPMTWYEQEG